MRFQLWWLWQPLVLHCHCWLSSQWWLASRTTDGKIITTSSLYNTMYFFFSYHILSYFCRLKGRFWPAVPDPANSSIKRWTSESTQVWKFNLLEMFLCNNPLCVTATVISIFISTMDQITSVIQVKMSNQLLVAPLKSNYLPYFKLSASIIL